MTKKICFSILLFVTIFTSINAQHLKTVSKNNSVNQLDKGANDKEIKINPDALKALNLGSPRKLSNRYYSVPSTSINALTNEILGKNIPPKDSVNGRIMLGISRFTSFYASAKYGKSKIKVDAMGFGFELPKRGGMVLSKEAMAPKYSPGFVFPSMARANQMAGASFTVNIESLLESIFYKDPPKLWTKYHNPLKMTYSVETEMPDSLVRIRETNAFAMDSIINTSHKKYKIIYLICADTDFSKTDFSDVAKYVAHRDKEFDLFPVSEKGMNDVSCIAKYLKKNAYFSPVYVMSGKHKEKLILMLDKSNQSISLMACDESIANKLEKLKRLP